MVEWAGHTQCPAFFFGKRVTAPEHDVIAAKTSTSDLPVVGEMIVNSLPIIHKESLATKARLLVFRQNGKISSGADSNLTRLR